MPENILVIEYEPRYTERVRQALVGQPLQPTFAHDADEALRALDADHPKLIVLSTIVPKTNTGDMIRAIRQREHLQQIPILLTISGYTGSSPKQDAIRMGATDILPKPYSEGDFLSKVHQMLGRAAGQLTSDQIFGDVLAESSAHGGAKKITSSRDDVDKLIANTLSGVMKKKEAPPKPKTQAGSAELDRIMADLTMTSRPKTSSGSVPRPAPVEDKIPISQPVFTAAPAAAPVEEEEPTDGIRFGQYVLLEKIATGGMAEVWKARMRGVEGFQKIVAIKKILPHLSEDREFIDMFIDEAKLAAQLNHNNIIHIYDLGKIQSSYYIAMEFVDGHDLKTILRRAQERDLSLTLELALFIASKIAAALDYAHRKRDFENHDMGLVHRDVSPQNVLISQEGDIKLCDFGIAKAASKVSHTQAGALKGKLQYMSPEQAWGRTIDRRSDIFALATVLFEMLTNRKLFTGDNEMSILEQVREARVQPPSKLNEDVTPEIDRIVLKALTKEPADRYQTAAEMARDLDSVLYEFKPTPTSADLAIYMHRLNAAPAILAPPPEEPAAVAQAVADTISKPAPAPTHRTPVAVAPAHTPAVAPVHTPPGVVMPAWENRLSSEKKKPPVAMIAAAAAAVVLVAGVGGYFALRGRSSSGAPVQKVASPVPVSAPKPVEMTTTAAPATTTETVAAVTTAAPSTQAPVIDATKVNEEVQKRLAAERTRLEEQVRKQQQAAAQPAPTPLLKRVVPQPQMQPQPQPVVPPAPVVQPPPVTQTTVAETRPPVPLPQPVVAPPPAPVPQTATQAEPARTREGDLVTAGSEDVPARMTRRANVPYPPMARMQRVEGTVLISALVSETGRVLDAKVIRPIARPVGLNEAALQIVRQSTFSPPMKDGVRVKSWTTVPVDFKL
jgi:TonB family protein